MADFLDEVLAAGSVLGPHDRLDDLFSDKPLDIPDHPDYATLKREFREAAIESPEGFITSGPEAGKTVPLARGFRPYRHSTWTTVPLERYDQPSTDTVLLVRDYLVVGKEPFSHYNLQFVRERTAWPR